MSRFIASILFLSHLLACQAQEPIHQIKHAHQKTTLLLDSAAAAQTILVDRYDRFFERVTPCEMSIQMKAPLGNGDAAHRAEFQRFIQKDMDSFTPKESRYVADIMKKVVETCLQVNPNLIPDSLILIKTKGQHYGDGVYYTRGNYIIIPADVLRKPDASAFASTMYHEIFHVYSRLHPEKRKALYQLIGFEHIGVEQLDLPFPLRDRVLYNPDGVDFGQKITLRLSDSETISAIPIIYANHEGFTDKKATFFSYLEFNLFEIKPLENGRWQVVTESDGLSSRLSIPNLPDFFRQIRDNTSYIIHPDEVLADNFSFIMLEKNGKRVSSKFSPEGKELLKAFEKIIQP